MGRRQVVSKDASFKNLKVAGIHLSGANAAKTSLVVMSCAKNNQYYLGRVYEKIGSVGSLFSDERLVDILKSEGPFSEVFIDCPLTLPPCARCVRASCPGAWECEDIEVAYMLSVQEKVRELHLHNSDSDKKIRRRPINPQTQRLWDALQKLTTSETKSNQNGHMTYNANMAPLVTRAITLQRRLSTPSINIKLKETTVPIVLETLCEQLDLEKGIAIEYRKFGVGKNHRENFFDALVANHIIAEDYELEDAIKVRDSVETFHAFIAGVVGCLHMQNQTTLPPKDFNLESGWVYLP